MLNLLLKTILCLCIYIFCSGYRSDIAEIEPALELLNSHGADFDMVEVGMYIKYMLSCSIIILHIIVLLFDFVFSLLTKCDFLLPYLTLFLCHTSFVVYCMH